MPHSVIATTLRSSGRTTTAECRVCGLHLERLPDADPAQALDAFRTHHPRTAQQPHSRRLPPGWRVPLSGPGALSQ